MRKNYASRKSIRDKCSSLFKTVSDGYQDKRERKNAIERCWNIFNCKLTEYQGYDGDSQVFVPIVHDAIEALVKRNSSMIFPPVGRPITCTSMTGDTPYATVSLLEHYARRADLRRLVPDHLRRGKVEGQWSLLVDWERNERTIRKLTTVTDPENPSQEMTDIEHDTIVDQGPTVELLPDLDLCVLPPTVASIDDARIVAVIRRYDKTTFEELADEMGFVKSQVDLMAVSKEHKDSNAARAEDAGVKMKGDLYQVYRIWKEMDLGDGREPCEIWIGGPDIILGVYKNPFWSGRTPVISAPAKTMPGSFYGKSIVLPVERMQYQLNDIINMGMDSARYSVLPIVMTDPQKNPNVGSMVLAAAAIWETNPNDTQFANFPALWKDAFLEAASIKQQIMESMGVNDMMLGKVTPGRKNAQQVAAQQAEAQQDITDDVRMYETCILEPLLEWFYELDQQYRDDDVLIETIGETGQQAKLQRIPPQQFGERYVFHWIGSDQVAGIQRTQQALGLLNILRGIPPQQLHGYRMDITPIVENITGTILGPTIAPRVLIDERDQMSIPPQTENEMLHNNLPVPVHPMDNDVEHIQAHQDAARLTGDPDMAFRVHIMAHVHQMQAKMQMAMPKPHGQPGIPGPRGQPGVAGTPRPGAIPGQTRPMQNPPGAIHQDQMADPRAGGRG